MNTCDGYGDWCKNMEFSGFIGHHIVDAPQKVNPNTEFPDN